MSTTNERDRFVRVGAALAALVTIAPAQAEILLDRCATPDGTFEQERHIRRDVRRALKDAPAVTGGVIDVYFHVIAASNGAGDVTGEAIAAQIGALNAGFAKTGWRFRLAEVTRTFDDVAFGECAAPPVEAAFKQALRRGGPGDLNIYTCNPGGGLLGWASYPSSYAQDPANDGVVLSFETLPGVAAWPYGAGDTGTHEVGHWMGLHHTFQGGCDTRRGDFVRDTPSQAGPSAACGAVVQCDADAPPAPNHNFMDSTDDGCMDAFTAGQDARMDALFTTYRASGPAAFDVADGAPLAAAFADEAP